MNVRVALRNYLPICFGSQTGNCHRTIEERLSHYKSGWQQLIDWDKKMHAIPVFQQVNFFKLLKSARNFLQRQTRKESSETVPFFIGMAGGSACGKTTIKKRFLKLFNLEAYHQIGWRKKMNGPIVDDIDLDNYYKDHSIRRKKLGDEAFFRTTNLDSPDALTLDVATRDVFRLKNGKAIRTPKINYADASRYEAALYKSPAPFFVLEGLFALQPKPLRNLLDMKIFVAADAETRKKRWWQRAPERNIQADEAGYALFNRTMRMHDKYVEPSSRYADVIINGTAPLADAQETLKRLTRLMLKTFSPVLKTEQ